MPRASSSSPSHEYYGNQNFADQQHSHQYQHIHQQPNVHQQKYESQSDDSNNSPQPSIMALESSPQPADMKKKHLCPTCDRGFTTSGHLARHARVHTGERNHKCPFPGCDTRCSRQDNLQQHYRIHLSPGSRRTSSRSGAPRAMIGGKRVSAAAAAAAQAAEAEAGSISRPPSTPPALESAIPATTQRMYTHSPAPNSPPALAHATLPATATVHQIDLHRTRSQSYDEYYHSNGPKTAYPSQEPTSFAFHPTPVPTNSQSYNAYHSLERERSSSPSVSSSSAARDRDSSRHSISHISHPHPRAASYHSDSSAHSGPPTPVNGYSHGSFSTEPAAMPNSSSPNTQIGYSPVGLSSSSSSSSIGRRYTSPPPILAPIQSSLAETGGRPSYTSYTTSSSQEYRPIGSQYPRMVAQEYQQQPRSEYRTEYAPHRPEYAQHQSYSVMSSLNQRGWSKGVSTLVG